MPSNYRGRLAPSPTGFLHLGHAQTFWAASERARLHGGELILRLEDLDAQRCRTEFTKAIYEDLRWLGLTWHEGPDIGGRHAPYTQSQRREIYDTILQELRKKNAVYPCTCSRKDIAQSIAAPHAGDEEVIYPGTCRHRSAEDLPATRYCWRFRLPPDQAVEFHDGFFGPVRFVTGKDFGDFVVWRQDHIPAYQLAVVADDLAMEITEVVRGEDLLLSTARQLLIYAALNKSAPAFFHCPLLRDEHGNRLAKRHDSLSLRALRMAGLTPETLSQKFAATFASKLERDHSRTLAR
jgi:glutamyl-tRNA synthetase